MLCQIYFSQFRLHEENKEVNDYERCICDQVSHQKNQVKIKRTFQISFFTRNSDLAAGLWHADVWFDLLSKSLQVDEYDHIEEQGDEDKDDAAEDPDGKSSQSSWVRGGCWEGRVEHVHQHLKTNFTDLYISHDIKYLESRRMMLTSNVVRRRPHRAGYAVGGIRKLTEETATKVPAGTQFYWNVLTNLSCRQKVKEDVFCPSPSQPQLKTGRPNFCRCQRDVGDTLAPLQCLYLNIWCTIWFSISSIYLIAQTSYP